MVLQKAIAAAREGDLQSLRELAETGCLTGTIVDTQGAGLVHHAARCGQLDCLCFLVTEAGLDANTRALNGATPVHDAAATGHTQELKWLVQVARCNVQVSGEVMKLWVLAPNLDRDRFYMSANLSVCLSFWQRLFVLTMLTTVWLIKRISL